jgi:DNA-binding response OmpR family regulator
MPATLSITPVPTSCTQQCDTTKASARATRILLVEDEPLTAEVFARALTHAGHQVEVARDGLQALRHLCDHTPSLVVLDLNLPKLGGAELVRRLRAAGHTKLPVVVVSGSSRRASDLAAAELWPGTWLEKPVKPKALVALVADFLREPDPAAAP